MASQPSRRASGRDVGVFTRLFACGAIVIAAGCGRPQTIVKGTVTLEGRPVGKAVVQFWPEQGNASTAVTVTDDRGCFATALKPVPFRVTVIAQVVDGKQVNPEDPKGPLIDRYKDVVPRNYTNAETTPLRVTAVAGKATVADFPLTDTPSSQ